MRPRSPHHRGWVRGCTAEDGNAAGSEKGDASRRWRARCSVSLLLRHVRSLTRRTQVIATYLFLVLPLQPRKQVGRSHTTTFQDNRANREFPSSTAEGFRLLLRLYRSNPILITSSRSVRHTQEVSTAAVTLLWSKVCSSCIRCKQKTKPADVQSQNLHQSRKSSHVLPTADKQQRCGQGELPPLQLLLHLLQAPPEPSLILP